MIGKLCCRCIRALCLETCRNLPYHQQNRVVTCSPIVQIISCRVIARPFVLCSGHQSFSNDKKVNDIVGNITHSSILVPYHGWRISHRTHHTNHGHVENDESWHPITERIYKDLVGFRQNDFCSCGAQFVVWLSVLLLFAWVSVS